MADLLHCIAVEQNEARPLDPWTGYGAAGKVLSGWARPYGHGW